MTREEKNKIDSCRIMTVGKGAENRSLYLRPYIGEYRSRARCEALSEVLFSEE